MKTTNLYQNDPSILKILCEAILLAFPWITIYMLFSNMYNLPEQNLFPAIIPHETACILYAFVCGFIFYFISKVVQSEIITSGFVKETVLPCVICGMLMFVVSIVFEFGPFELLLPQEKSAQEIFAQSISAIFWLGIWTIFVGFKTRKELTVNTTYQIMFVLALTIPSAPFIFSLDP